MPGLSRIAAALMVAALLVVLPRAAQAQAGRAQTIHVLAIDSDDADEQADALTGSLRAHIRQTPGWTLLETTQSLSMLTAAFRCPQKPDPACLVRIGDKLQANQFIWGVMNKIPGRQVAVELHLWTRGRPDEVARETFSENVKEANDDALGRISVSLLTKLIGAAGGVLVLHSNAENAAVFVDGQQVATLDHGRATLPLAPGPHSVDVQAPGFAKVRKEVTMASGASVQLEVPLEADATATVAGSGKPFPTRTVVGWSSLAAGGVLGIVGLAEGIAWFGYKSDVQNAKNVGPGLYGTGQGLQDPCNPPAGTASKFGNTLQAGCSAQTSAEKALAVEITTFAVGGALVITGAVLLLKHPDSDTAKPPQSGLASLRLVPDFGAKTQSLSLVGRF